MRVQPFNYPIENSLVKKIDLMIARCIQENPKRDAVLIIEGAEGEGKSTFSIALAYYIAQKTGRPFSAEDIYFDLEKMIDVLKDSENKIAIWDEPALQGLSKDALTNIVKNLERLLMMARKKRHFLIINMAYFNKFSDYIVWQRPLGMIHCYSRNNLEAGRFIYIKKGSLEGLYNEWRSKKKRNYKKFASKRIRGTFPDVLNPKYKNNVLSVFDVNKYEEQKDKAIFSIGVDKTKGENLRFTKFKVKVALGLRQLKEKYNVPLKESVIMFGTTKKTYNDWLDIARKKPELTEGSPFFVKSPIIYDPS